MNLSISHIAGFCLDTLRLLNRPSLFIGVIFFLVLLKITVVILRTISFKRKLIIQTTPKIVLKLIEKYGLSEKVKVIQDEKPLAFCLGFFKPIIYLSTSLIKLMNRYELEAIILHEKYHLLKKDNILLVVVSFIKQFFLLFPVFIDFFDSLIKTREVQADRYGSILLGKKQPVAGAFKKILRFDVNNSYLSGYSSAFTNHQHFEARIHALFVGRSVFISFKLRNILISTLSLIVLTGFFFSPWQKTQASNQNQKTFICLKNTDCSKHC